MSNPAKRAGRWIAADPRRARIGGGLVGLVLLLALLVPVSPIGLTGGPDDDFATVRAHDVPYDGRSPRLPTGDEQRVLVRFARPSLGQLAAQRERAGRPPLTPGEQRGYVRSLRRETAKTRSALEARGIRLSAVVSFERTFNGFAAAVPTRDLAALNTAGIRARPVRRFFPALTDPLGTAPAPPGTGPQPSADQPPVALLSTGVALGQPRLRGRVDPGRDAVDRDDDPSPGTDPRLRSRSERDGTALAGVLTAAGERVRAFRVAGLRGSGDRNGAAEEYGTTDELLAALERVVDPDGNGDTEDALPVALVAVAAPYAGFDGSSEAVAADGAAALGTLVVAPAGQEGAGAGPHGVLATPAAVPAVLGVGAAVAEEPPVARAELTLGDDVRVTSAALLGGPPPPERPGETARPVSESDALRLLDRGLAGRVAVVRAGAGSNPAAQAAAAAAVGATVVLVADPRDDATLPALPAGRVGVPVLGVTGDAARAVLDVEAGAEVEIEGAKAPELDDDDLAGAPDAREGAGAPGAAASTPTPAERARALAGLRLAPSSSRGPALDGTPKPDLTAPALALAPTPEGGSGLIGGTAVAAARAAATAAALLREQPDLPPAQLIARLRAAALPGDALPAAGAGAGVLDPSRAGTPAIAATPPKLALTGLPFAREWTRTLAIPIANPGTRPLRIRAGTESVPGVRASVAPADVTLAPGQQRDVTLTLRGDAGLAAGFASGRVSFAANGAPALALPWQAAVGRPGPARVSDVRLVRRRGRVEGVRFALGRFRRGDPAIGAPTRIEPVQRLELTLEDAAGGLVRRLTPAGGAQELLPAVYEYRLARKDLRALAAGRYRFRLRAFAPRRRDATDVRSERFVKK